MRHPVVSSSILAIAFTALLPGAAAAVLGDLTPLGCTEDTGLSACPEEAPGLNGATATAVSPNGRSVYVASFDGDAVAAFGRALDGSLTSEACFQSPGGMGCHGDGTDTPGLDSAIEVVVSPDNRNVYVVSYDPGAIVVFDRAANGTLTFDGCIQDNSSNTFCKNLGGNTPGLRSAASVAISPDGNNVYVASFLSDGIAIFDRAPGGKLTPAGCIQNTGRTECASLGGTTPGLDGAYDVVVSNDGANVYVASYVSDAVVVFDRAPDGSLTPAGCLQDSPQIACSGSLGNAPALGGARGLAMSKDGEQLYVAAYDDDAVSVLDIAPDGTVSHASCIQNTGGSSCGATSPGLDSASSVIASPDGVHVYVASVASDALVALDREDSTGALSASDCFQNTGRTECTNAGGATTPGLDGAVDVSVSPLGNTVYVASFNSSAIVPFDRESPVTSTTTSTLPTTTTTEFVTTSTTTTTMETTTTTVPDFDCGDVNGNGTVTTTDALAILRAAVGGNECGGGKFCICNVAGGGSILTSDALAALRIAVGQPVTPACTC